MVHENKKTMKLQDPAGGRQTRPNTTPRCSFVRPGMHNAALPTAFILLLWHAMAARRLVDHIRLSIKRSRPCPVVTRLLHPSCSAPSPDTPCILYIPTSKAGLGIPWWISFNYLNTHIRHSYLVLTSSSIPDGSLRSYRFIFPHHLASASHPS